MIQFCNIEFKTQNDIDSFKEELEEAINETFTEKIYYLYCFFLDDVFERSCALQRDVENRISNDLVSCVNLPWDVGDDFDKLTFSLFSLDGRKVKKREELLFQSYCDKHFGQIVGLESLFAANFD